MKVTSILLALAGSMVFFAHAARSQTPPSGACVLETAEAPYTQAGSTYANNPNNFNWKAETWPLVIKQDNGTFIVVNEESPFWDPGNVIFPNTIHLAINEDGARDFEPNDGWELLIDDRGTIAKPVRLPTVALYNRYESKVRLFQWFGVTNGIFQTGKTKIERFAQGSPRYTSGLFEHANTPMNALDRFDQSTMVQSMNVYVVQGGTWFLTEFAAAYDPCTCIFRSGFEIDPRLYQEQNLSLSLTGTSTSDPIIENLEPKTSSDIGFNAALGKVIGTGGIATQGYKTYDGLKKLVKDGVGLMQSFNGDENAKPPFKIPSFLKNIPKIGAFLTVAELLIGGGKSASITPKPHSYYTDYKFAGTGSLGLSQTYENRFIFTPGSVKATQPPGPDNSKIPVYNNPLGIMTLLETPKLTIYRPIGDWYYAIKLNEPLKYAINPTAALGALIQLKGAFYFQFCKETEHAEALGIHNMLRVGDKIMRSPYMPLSALTEYTMSSSYFIPFAGSGCILEGNNLEIVATFQPQGVGESFYAARYRTEFSNTSVGNINLIPQNPYAGVPENITVENVTLTSNTTYKAWNTITVITDMINLNGNFMFLNTAGTLIFKGTNIPNWIKANLNADGEYNFSLPSPAPGPDGDYVPIFWTPGIPNPPQTPTQIAAFCTNPIKYKPELSLQPDEEDAFYRQMAENNEPGHISVSPSIGSEYTNVNFELAEPKHVRISLVNMVGQVVQTPLNNRLELGTYIQNIDLSSVPSGIYMVVVFLDDKHAKSFKVVKQ